MFPLFLPNAEFRGSFGVGRFAQIIGVANAQNGQRKSCPAHAVRGLERIVSKPSETVYNRRYCVKKNRSKCPNRQTHDAQPNGKTITFRKPPTTKCELNSHLKQNCVATKTCQQRKNTKTRTRHNQKVTNKKPNFPVAPGHKLAEAVFSETCAY